MNQRVRNPSMSSSYTAAAATACSPFKNEQRFHRFLRPGALARLRDTRISSRSPRCDALLRNPSLRFSPPSSPAPPAGGAAALQIPMMIDDGFPFFASRIHGPKYPQRKKLLAAKTMLSIGSIPTSPVRLEPTDPPLLLDVFSADLLLGH